MMPTGFSSWPALRKRSALPPQRRRRVWFRRLSCAGAWTFETFPRSPSMTKTPWKSMMLSRSRQEEAEYVVGIHIADASAFVSRGDLLDAEALRRASTIYLPTKAVRMLPERLSTGSGQPEEGRRSAGVYD